MAAERAVQRQAELAKQVERDAVQKALPPKPQKGHWPTKPRLGLSGPPPETPEEREQRLRDYWVERLRDLLMKAMLPLAMDLSTGAARARDDAQLEFVGRGRRPSTLKKRVLTGET